MPGRRRGRRSASYWARSRMSTSAAPVAGEPGGLGPGPEPASGDRLLGPLEHQGVVDDAGARADVGARVARVGAPRRDAQAVADRRPVVDRDRAVAQVPDRRPTAAGRPGPARSGDRRSAWRSASPTAPRWRTAWHARGRWRCRAPRSASPRSPSRMPRRDSRDLPSPRARARARASTEDGHRRGSRTARPRDVPRRRRRTCARHPGSRRGASASSRAGPGSGPAAPGAAASHGP